MGLGYVGIPVAVSFAAASFDVTGIDPNAERASALNAGTLPLGTTEPGLGALLQAGLASGRFRATTDPEALAASDVVIVAVDTPLGDHRRPDVRQLTAACATVAERAPANALVVVESTLAPGAMRHSVAPVFAGRGGTLLVHCPERVRPGRLLRNLRGMSRLIGADDPDVGVAALDLYRTVVEAELTVTDWETAEVIKVAENATRDVQIALANQLAVICDHAGVDFRRVRDQINRLWRTEPLVLEAGAGVGGHCLPKDPWFLVSGLPEGAPADLIVAARTVNDGMVDHAAAIVDRACRDAGLRPERASVAVLGLTYDANADDRRNAPGPRLAARLRERGMTVYEHDPFVASTGTLAEALRGRDAAVVVVPHTAYVEADWAGLRGAMRARIVVDLRRALQADALRSLGFTYRALGVAALR